MATVVNCFAIQGIEGYKVDIEAKSLEGMPMISIIGMGDQAVKEAAERLEAAIDESGYAFPKKKVIISLAPGDRKKKGTHFDLAMAICLLQQCNEITCKELNSYGFVGELSLDGHLRGCTGVLPMIIAAKNAHIARIVVPKDNYQEAKLVKGIEVLAFESLRDVVLHLEGKKVQKLKVDNNFLENQDNLGLDFSDVKGQNEIVEATVLAAAGGHNMLMIGEPGCGKTMIASRIPSILPEMTEEECLEITKIYSITGALKGNGLIKQRPFRAPHHNASLNSLIGGGVNALPGEVSLAHNGVLFLDELAEFTKRTLDALRQPIEDKKVSIARVNGSNTFPSNFMFVAAMNPCPCGYFPSEKCRCTDYEIIKYRTKISGPIMDRIDIQKEVKPVGFFEIANANPSKSSAELRAMVVSARQIQKERYKDIPGVYTNAQMTTDLIKRYCELDTQSTEYMRHQSDEYNYSARVIHKLLRMARTSADLAGHANIQLEDVKKIMTYRNLDKSNRELVIVR